MKLEAIPFFSNLNERALFLLFITCIGVFHLSYKYVNYLDFKEEELLKVDAKVINLYPKDGYTVARFETPSYHFFSSLDANMQIKKHTYYSMIIVTQSISFVQYLKGFYTTSFEYTIKEYETTKDRLHTFVSNQHESTNAQELFSALFLALPINSELRDFFAKLGISHLIAISGFHLGVLSFCLFILINTIYKPIHQHYLLYRNRRFDVMVLCCMVLFVYLLLTGFVPSLLRAFIMFVVALYLLRRNIELFSYEVLFYCFLLIIVLFPSYLFSIGLWFSFIAVFYIYLFVQYFTKGNKFFLAFFFNVWIFLVFNPIVHYFFEQTAYAQLLSPIITLLFTLFYPLELLLHMVGSGHILDGYINYFLQFSISSYSIFTPLWFIIVYVGVSLLSVIKREAFYLLNLLLVGFNIYLYVS